MKFKISLAQINPTLGNLEKNLVKHLEFAEKAILEGARVIVFPELSITGYLLRDLTYEVALPSNSDFFKPIKEMSKNIDIVLGFAEKGEDKIIYNSALYLSKGEIKLLYRKMFPPTHGMFEELRFFGRGETYKSIKTDYGKISVIICRDFFHPPLLSLAYFDNVDFVFAISNMPLRGLKGEKPQIQETVENASSVYTNFFSFFIVYVNRVGFDDGLGFYGGSFVQSPTGKKIVRAGLFEEEIVTGTVDTEDIYKKRTSFPLIKEENKQVFEENLRKIIGGSDD
ncbi:nitrilase-related carbon-nitrogen hydrolase [Caldisericum exile]|uniref:Hydrolase n=1 Tax=Caldisericum exile (strain DSM 21853 / NBRC 104410 / AZM16c01) TaxID=511051 RepID=A0A7U6GER8_CALEA|nr:nitrilase-related carbon-nitrogen hydrolase [Caldisericum exile]BAL81053.1 putative hydrolase [Caldisericum exile AZM16c01]